MGQDVFPNAFAVQKCGTTDNGPGLLFLLSGHDVERWMLRSLAIFSVSGNFAIDGAVIDQDFIDRLRIVELLEDVKEWKKPIGFYLTRGLGHQFWRRDNIQIAPVVRLAAMRSWASRWIFRAWNSPSLPPSTT
jgi:hypothetical protein